MIMMIMVHSRCRRCRTSMNSKVMNMWATTISWFTAPKSHGLPALTPCRGVLLASLYSVTFILLVMVLTAFFHRAAMGSQDELALLTLGKPPSTTALLQGLSALCEAIEEAWMTTKGPNALHGTWNWFPRTCVSGLDLHWFSCDWPWTCSMERCGTVAF